MTSGAHGRRRALVSALAGVLLASASRLSFGQPGGESAAEESGAGDGAVLTVVVTGDGKPIDEAEVKVKFTRRSGGEATIPTDEAGEAVFKLPGTGAATVRVIATGWESVLKEVALKKGPQKLTVELKALKDG